MGRIAIMYATMTGHSRKIAAAIGRTMNIEAVNVSARPMLAGVDLLFIVGGIYGGESLPRLLKYVQTLHANSVKKVALVTSSAREQKQDSVRKMLEDRDIEVLDEFRCPGSFLFLSFGHPNKADVKQAVDFALKISGMASEGAEEKGYNMAPPCE